MEALLIIMFLIMTVFIVIFAAIMINFDKDIDHLNRKIGDLSIDIDNFTDDAKFCCDMIDDHEKRLSKLEVSYFDNDGK